MTTSTFRYRVRFTRWDKRKTERRKSGDTFTHAADFRAACDFAEAVLTGLRAGDPVNEYAILAIEQDGVGGTDCRGGLFMFETKDEFFARCAEREG